VEEVRRLVAANPAISRQELAQALHLSSGHLGQVFKEYTGMELKEFLRRARLEHAVHLLRSSALIVKEIAEACGYEHESSFCRAFVTAMGIPPLVFRSRHHSSFEMLISPALC
jgi:two-component system, response regulator YesN